eukprot:TRINITY_DN2798_c0_g4_i1.p1 TRINITY_DN2798_c0_g4~~TRINITY_DN2798_c0_g4_i1.p1  ORF type:complete len:391 (-),score=94.28 TRINITY_DN2798_c0_g4_i1:159-1331(-)
MKKWWDKSKDVLGAEYFKEKQKEFRNYQYNIYILHKAALKIQHWFFLKRHPENVPKARAAKRKPAKEVKKSRLPKVTSNNEQEVLDACWTKGTLGNKLRNKIIKRMERVKEINKSQCPLTARGVKQTSRATPSTKGMGKRNMSSVVLLVQERNKPRLATSRNSIRPALACNTPLVNFSFAGRASAMENYLTSSRISKDSAQNLHHTGRKRELSRSSCRDNSVYETLRDQLQKITLKLDMEGIRSNDTSEWRQRRTRKERSDRNPTLANGSSLLQSQGSLTLRSSQKIVKPRAVQGFHTHRKMETAKRPFTRNELSKPGTQSTKALNKPKAKPVKPQKNVTQTTNSQRSKVLLKKGPLNSKSTLSSKNVAKKPVRQKENVEVNKVSKTAVV